MCNYVILLFLQLRFHVHVKNGIKLRDTKLEGGVVCRVILKKDFSWAGKTIIFSRTPLNN